MSQFVSSVREIEEASGGQHSLLAMMLSYL
jgi:hypothetical protein